MAGSSFRRAGALLAASALAVSLGTANAAKPPANRSSDSTSGKAAELCTSRGAIPAADLAAGVVTTNCSLEGRVVVAGGTAVVVPPDGYGVGSDGVSAAGTSGSPSLEVENMGGVVTASVDRGLSPGESSGQERGADARAVGPCQAGQFALEAGGHPWGSTLKWRYHAKSTPKRFGRLKALAQIKSGMSNIRTGRNDCGLHGRFRATSKYVGSSRSGPDVKVNGGRVTCGPFNRTNKVGWGALPGGLIGWTCYWWSGSKMVATDMRISPSKVVVLHFPRPCSNRYDLQSLSTHEWGHSWGLGHVRNDKLTMHHFLPPCSPAFRTLGLGDWRGMRKLYGLR
jgi:Matrixin